MKFYYDATLSFTKHKKGDVMIKFKCLIIFLCFNVTAQADLVKGLEWLSLQQQQTGNVATAQDLAIGYQNISETLAAFALPDQTVVFDRDKTRTFFNAIANTGSEYLARQILAQFSAGDNTDAAVQSLLNHQNSDGGFGLRSPSGSAVLATGYALQALAIAKTNHKQAIERAIKFLLEHQNPDGSYGYGTPTTNSVFATTIVVRALQRFLFEYDLSESLQQTTAFLQQATLTENHERALVLLAVAPLTTDASLYESVANALAASQNQLGHWDHDVYTTALAIQALHLVANIKFPVDVTTGQINGRFVDDTTGLLLANVSVNITAVPSTQSADDGAFTLTEISAGGHTLSYELNGYQTATQAVTVQAGQIINLGILRLTPIPGNGILSGVITDADTGVPLFDVSITVTGAETHTTSTDRSGAYRMAVLPGDVAVSASLSGYATASGAGVILAGGNLAFSPALTRAGQAPTDGKAQVFGKVVDGKNNGIAQAQIHLVEISATGLSDGDGAFRFTGIEPGELTLRISAPGYQSAQTTLVVPANTRIDLGLLHLSLQPPVVSKIVGTVTDADFNTPVVGASIVVQGQSVVTDSQGRYEVINVDSGPATVSVHAVGYQTRIGSVEIVPLTQAVANFQLTRNAIEAFDIVNVHTEDGGREYEAFGEVELGVMLRNSGTEPHPVRMFLKVVNAKGQVVEQFPAIIVPLGGSVQDAWVDTQPGEITETELEWHFGAVPAGNYQLIVQAYDGPSGRLLAERDQFVDILATNRMGGMVSFEPPITQLTSQKPVEIIATIGNRGNLPIDAGSVTATVTLKTAGPTPRQELANVSLVADQGLKGPAGMAKAPDGSVYVVNRNGTTLSKILPDGRVIEVANGFSLPTDVEIDAQGNIYVLNLHRSFVKIDTTGVRTQITTGLISQHAFEVLSDGKILIIHGNFLSEITADGTVTTRISGGLFSPMGMAVDSRDRIFVANRSGNSVSMFADGVLSTFVDGIDQPYGVAVDANDDLYVTSFSTNTLHKVTSDGAVTTVSTDLSGPYDVKIDSTGRPVVSNHGSHTVVRLEADGSLTELVGPSIAEPSAAAYDASGNVYIGNVTTRDIVKYDPDHKRDALIDTGQSAQSIITHPNGDLTFLASEKLYRVTDNETTLLTQGAIPNADTLVADGNHMLVSDLKQIWQVDDTGTTTPYLLPQFATPRIIRQATNGAKYLLNQTYITKITPEGRVSRVFDGLDARISSMALDVDNNLLVTEYYRKNVLKISPQGDVEVLAQTDFNPSAIVVDENGQVLVATFGGTTIFSIDAQGTVSEFQHVTQPIYYDMVFDHSQNLWMLNGNALSKLDTTGQETQFSLTHGRALTAAREGGVYIATLSAVRHISEAGEIEDITSDPVFRSQFLMGAVVDKQSRWWILHANGRLTRLAANKQVDKQYSSLFKPRGITFADNDLIVANTGNNLILRITDPGGLPEIVAFGTYQKLVSESAESVLIANNSTVKRLHLDSGEITNLIAGFTNIQALAVSPTGEIFVGDGSRNKIAFYQHDGTLINHHYGVRAPQGILFDADGQLLIANAVPPAILRLQPNGLTEIFANRPAQFLWLESNGDITASNGSILEYARDGSLKRLYGRAPFGLIRTSTGQLVVVDSRNSALLQYDDKHEASFIASGLSRPRDLETNPAGELFVAENGSGLINRILPDFSMQVLAEGLPGIERLNINQNNLIAVYQSNLAIIDRNGVRDNIPFNDLIPFQVTGLSRLSDGQLLVGTRQDSKLHRMGIGQTTPDLQVGDAVFTGSADFPALPIGTPSVPIHFGSWTPEVSGDYLVTLNVASGVDSEISNALHVGPNASSTLTLHQEQVFPGDRAATATLNIVGADSTSITRIDTDATALAAVSETLGRAIGADTKGTIYASDRNRIVKIAPDGTVSDFVTGLPTLGNGMAVDSKDNLYVVSVNQVLKITPDGDVSTLAEFPTTVYAVAVDYQDAVFAVDHSLSRIYPDGRTEVLASTRNARGLTIDVFGNFYVLTANQTILRITPDYQVSEYFDKAKYEYEGVNVTADCADNLLFAPTTLLPFKTNGEEDIITQLIGATGEARLVLEGPSMDPLLRDMDVLFYDRFGQRLLIWTDLNQGQIFSFPVICGGIDVAAHIVTRADVDFSSSDPAPTSTVDRGDGTQELIWSLTEVDQRGFDLQLNWLFKNLGEGETRALAQAAFLVFSNSFRPGEKVKVPIDMPSLLAASQKFIIPTLDAARYSADARVGIQVAVGNDSGTEFDGTLKLSITDAEGNLAEALPDIAINHQPVLSEQAVASEWDTGQRFQGDYQLQVVLLDENSRTVASGRVPFVIDPSAQPDAATVTTIAAEKLVYKTTDRVQLFGRIRNTATNARQRNSVVTVTVTGPDHQIVFTDSRAVNELFPGSLTDVTFQVALNNVPVGEYRVNFVTTDSATGFTLDNSSNHFQVQPIGPLGLLGQVKVNTTLVQAGCADSMYRNGHTYRW